MNSFREIKGTGVKDQKEGMVNAYSECLRTRAND